MLIKSNAHRPIARRNPKKAEAPVLGPSKTEHPLPTPDRVVNAVTNASMVSVMGGGLGAVGAHVAQTHPAAGALMGAFGGGLAGGLVGASVCDLLPEELGNKLLGPVFLGGTALGMVGGGYIATHSAQLGLLGLGLTAAGAGIAAVVGYHGQGTPE